MLIQFFLVLVNSINDETFDWSGVVGPFSVVQATIFEGHEPSCSVSQQERESEHASGTMGKKQKKSGDDR